MKNVKSAATCFSILVAFIINGQTETGSMQSIRPGPEEKRLQVFVGKWITEGETVASANMPSVQVHASDMYEWASGGFFILHQAYGLVGSMSGSSIEMIGYDKGNKKYVSYFFDANGEIHKSDLIYQDGTWIWEGKMGQSWARCKGTFSNDGKVLTANHERSDNGINWVPTISVKLTKAE